MTEYPPCPFCGGRAGQANPKIIICLSCNATAPKEVWKEPSRILALEKALEFYADPSTYHAVTFLFDSPCGGFDDDFDDNHGDAFYDRPMPGQRARKALGRDR